VTSPGHNGRGGQRTQASDDANKKCQKENLGSIHEQSPW
jgi:hypothetical protein